MGRCTSVSALRSCRRVPDEGDGWDTKQGLPLALPRLLMRRPYGKQSDAVAAFEFEEWTSESSHATYLWGNPALACACLLGQSFRQSGWNLEPGELVELGGLPVHVFKQEGESRMIPCAEIWLNETAAEDYLERGLMPFLSIRGRDAIRLARFQSVSEPARPLEGRWRWE